MQIQVIQLLETPNSTLSALLDGGLFQCFVLEDGYRDKKVPGETRIPEGIYIVKPRTEGRVFQSLKNRLKHKFVPWITNVPDFEYILIHPGIVVADTRGCPMVGEMAGFGLDGNFFLKNSTPAYEKLYRKMEAAFDRGETVTVEILRGGGLMEKMRDFGVGVGAVV